MKKKIKVHVPPQLASRMANNPNFPIPPWIESQRQSEIRRLMKELEEYLADLNISIEKEPDEIQ